ncbi:MAG TPA: GvpL/GvpF family gas vesicle protein [Gemmatimonadaceae bacterium]|nr:GvpL/GvpF family gas vesicle protein [Gemmatimonadaceae bacterium]
MTTHLYCILPHVIRGGLPPGLLGLGGARVRALVVGELVAWVSDAERERGALMEEVRAHDAVVEAALSSGATPMPARFGQTFADDDACSQALSRRAASLESALQAVQGCIEMTLIITPSTRRMLRELEPVVPQMLEPGAPGAGRQYLETLRAREASSGTVERLARELASRLETAVGPLLRKKASPRSVVRMPMLTLSHLIDRDDVDAYREALSAVAAGPELRFLVVGPRAPYSFCGLDAGPAGAHGMNLAD